MSLGGNQGIIGPLGSDVPSIMKTHCQHLQINGDHISVAITPFSNRFFVIVSSYGKIGNLLDISRVSWHL